MNPNFEIVYFVKRFNRKFLEENFYIIFNIYKGSNKILNNKISDEDKNIIINNFLENFEKDISKCKINIKRDIKYLKIYQEIWRYYIISIIQNFDIYIEQGNIFVIS